MRFREFITLILIMATAFIGTSAFSQNAFPTKAEDFVRQASICSEFEITSSQLAVKRAIMPEVRDFARTMIVDHTTIGDTLKSTLASADIDISPTKDLDEKHQKIMDVLKSAPAESFDNLYIQAQSAAQDEAVLLFKDYAETGDNPVLVKFSTDMLPILEQHEGRINSLRQPLASVRP